MSNIVPKINNEGQLGREGRRWAEVHAGLALFDSMSFHAADAGASEPSATSLWINSDNQLMYGDQQVAVGDANTSQLQQVIDLLTDADGDGNGLNSLINTIDANFDTLQEIATSLAALETASSAHASSITNLSGEISALETSVTALSISVAATLSDHGTRISANEGAISTNASSISGINTTLSNLSSDVSANTSDIGDINTLVPSTATNGTGKVVVRDGNGAYRSGSVATKALSATEQELTPADPNVGVNLGSTSAPFAELHVGSASTHQLIKVNNSGLLIAGPNANDAEPVLRVPATLLNNASHKLMSFGTDIAQDPVALSAGLDVERQPDGTITAILPETTNSIDLGSDSKRFKKVFAQDFIADANSVVIGAVTLSEANGKLLIDSVNVATEAFVATEIAAITGSSFGSLSALDTKFTNLTGTNATNIQTNADAITALDTSTAGSINAINTEIAAATLSISLLQSGLSSEQSVRGNADTQLGNRITALSLSVGDIISNTDPAAIDSLTELVAAFQAADSNLSTAITNALGTHTSELSAHATANSASFAALNTAISGEISDRENADTVLQTSITANSNSIGALQTDLTNLQTDVTNQSGDISAINGTLGEHDTAITANSNSIGALQTSVSALDTQVTANSNSIGTINGTLTTLDTAITANSNSIGALQTSVNALDSAITANSNSIGTINGTLASIDSAITANSNSIGSLQTELDATQSGAGLGTNGAYTANTLTNYIDAATSLFNADTLLDQQLHTVTADLSSLQTQVQTIQSGNSDDVSALQGEIDATQTGAGLGTGGAYTANSNAVYIGGASSLKNADDLLDAAIATKQGTLTAGSDVVITASNTISVGPDVVRSADISNFASVTYVDSAVAGLVDSAPATLDTLNELAAALGDDPNFATTVTNSIAAKQDALNAGDNVTLTGATISVDLTNYALTSSLGDVDTRLSAVESSYLASASLADYSVSIAGNSISLDGGSLGASTLSAALGLSDYATAASLTALSNTVSAREHITDISGDLTLSASGTLSTGFAISDYVTSASLSASLSDYALSATVTTLSGDLTSATNDLATLTTTVNDREDVKDIGGGLSLSAGGTLSTSFDIADYITASSVSANYATAASFTSLDSSVDTLSTSLSGLSATVSARQNILSIGGDLALSGSGTLSNSFSISDYVTSAALGTTLADYVTSATLDATLGDYVTSATLSDTLSSYITASSVSSNYATASSLTALSATVNARENILDIGGDLTLSANGTLSNNFSISDYVTSATLDDTLGSYITAASVSSNYATSASVTTLSGTVSSLSTSLNSLTSTVNARENILDIGGDLTLSANGTLSNSFSISDYVTSATLNDTLSDYATAASLTSVTGRVATLEGAGYITTGDLTAGSYISLNGGTISVAGSLSSAVSLNTAKVTYTDAKVDARIALQVGANLDLTNQDTDDVAEGVGNLYYTDARARGAISVTDAGGDGSLTYDSSTGVLTYTGPSSSDVTQYLNAGTNLTLSGGTFSLSPLLTNIIVSGHVVEAFDHGDLGAHDSATDFGSVSSNLIIQSVDLGGLDNGSFI